MRGIHDLSAGKRRGAQWLIAIFAFVVVAVAAAGCGSDSDSSSGDSTGGTSAELSGDPVKVMTFADITVQPPAPSYEFVADSVKAAIDHANEEGGINGRPIELTVCDTKMNPNTATECGRKAVEEEVVAVVGGASTFDGQVATVVEEAGIPMVGPVAQSPPTYNGKLSYCSVFQTSSAMPLFTKLAKELGVKKVSLITAGGTPATQTVAGAFEEGAKANGLEVGAVVTPSPQTTNFAPAAAQAAEGGAEAVVVLPFSSPPAVAEQIKQQEPDLKVIWPSWAFSFGGEWPESQNGAEVLASAQPPTATDVPGIAEYLQQMDEFSPDTQLTETSAYQWLSGDWFVRVAQQIKGPITAKSVVAAMNDLHEFDMKGITPPYDSDKRGKVAFEKCAENATGVHVRLKDNELYAVEPGKFIE
jgi:branched-chain amino acid transport system substrate-binding protein